MKLTPIGTVRHEVFDDGSDTYSTVRRSGPDAWERAMGESWEPVFNTEELEAAYRILKGVTVSSEAAEIIRNSPDEKIVRVEDSHEPT